MSTLKTFDYRTLRFTIGIVSLSIAPVVQLAAGDDPLSSISHSYYTGGRDLFVGLLFVVGGLMFSYNGHDRKQSLASKLAAISACLIALFPTAEMSGGDFNIISFIHGASAAFLFLILALFCFKYFPEAKHKDDKNRTSEFKRRVFVYYACGTIILLSMAAIVINKLFDIGSDNVTFLGEYLALVAFGIAWIVAGKFRLFGFLVAKE